MRLVQMMDATRGRPGRRLGMVEGDTVHDLTAARPDWQRAVDLFRDAQRAGTTMDDLVRGSNYREQGTALSYDTLLQRRPGEGPAWLLPPVDHPDPAHCLITGTGLTHLGSMAQRDSMHKAAADPSAPKTDSQRMFERGLEGGRPARGVRGVSPEWFYKGTGHILRAPNDWLDVPPYGEDCGEEPEIVGCYVIGEDGLPYRLGFTVGNEWADHAFERINYLYLAHSKLCNCSLGPELVTDEPFRDIRGVCRITRGDEVLYDSGELLTGEDHMCHNLANMEDHHFKHAQFRMPGDVHLHFFGTMKLSYGHRGVLQDGDRIEIAFDRMGPPLVNYVRRIPRDDTPVAVHKG
jgi:hypothetical protein